jgi:hypothetical protein
MPLSDKKKQRNQRGLALAEVMVAAIVMSAISAAVMMTTSHQSKSQRSLQIIGERDRIFDSLVRNLQNENNLRHSFDNGTVYPAAGNANQNMSRSAGNAQIGNCIHSMTTVCNTAGSAVSRPNIILPGTTGQWTPFVLVKPSGSANAGGAIPFQPIAGTDVAPVRYTLDGQRCNTPAATATCQLEAVAYARPQCSTSPCMPADSIMFTIVLRQGFDASNVVVPIRGGTQKELGHRILRAEVSIPRTMLARQGVKALNCPNIVVGGVVTQQRMIGIGPSGDAICGAVDSCPEGTLFAGTNPNGTPNCQTQPQQQCQPYQDFMGFAPGGSGQIICVNKSYVNCPAGTISTGNDWYGNPICQSLQSGYCYTTQGACAGGYFTQSYSTFCQQTNCGKKGGCQTVCDKAATCCRPNG